MSHIVFEVADIALDPLVVVIFTDTVLNATIPMLFIVLNLSIINTTSDSADQSSNSSWHVCVLKDVSARWASRNGPVHFDTCVCV